MNITRLFEMQKVLRDRIGYKGEDRPEKLTLAFIVELGECANEWRGFKFWSVNQEPRTIALRHPAMMEEDKEYYNPLLEEYVDGLHFVLEHGLDLLEKEAIMILPTEIEPAPIPYRSKTIVKQFKYVLMIALSLDNEVENEINLVDQLYSDLFEQYLTLGEMLGFTPEQIEQAYMDKNQINHERQANGY